MVWSPSPCSVHPTVLTETSIPLLHDDTKYDTLEQRYGLWAWMLLQLFLPLESWLICLNRCITLIDYHDYALADHTLYAIEHNTNFTFFFTKPLWLEKFIFQNIFDYLLHIPFKRAVNYHYNDIYFVTLW